MKLSFPSALLGAAALIPLSSLITAAPLPTALQKRDIQGVVIPKDFADPALIQVGGSWYAFSTAGGGKHVQVATSSDFSSWQVLDQDALPVLGAWADDALPWAPDVIQMPDGTFVLYYAAMNTDHDAHCVGAATSTVVTGPYTAVDTSIVCPQGQGGAIDPAGFRDTDGSQWLTYKIDTNAMYPGGPVSCPIMIVRMTGDGMEMAEEPTQILERSDADGPTIEAPSLVRMGDGTYVLFFSSNAFNGPWYDTSYATASSIKGPYTKAAKPLLMSGDYAGPNTPPLYSPGGLDVAIDGTHVVFHADLGHQVSTRQMYAGTISFSNGVVTI